MSEPPVNQSDFQCADVSYICPECRTRIEYQVSYLVVENFKEINYTKAHWCHKCGARHKFDYKVIVKQGKPKVKISNFSSDDESQRKWFSVSHN